MSRHHFQACLNLRREASDVRSIGARIGSSPSDARQNQAANKWFDLYNAQLQTPDGPQALDAFLRRESQQTPVTLKRNLNPQGAKLRTKLISQRGSKVSGFPVIATCKHGTLRHCHLQPKTTVEDVGALNSLPEVMVGAVSPEEHETVIDVTVSGDRILREPRCAEKEEPWK